MKEEDELGALPGQAGGNDEKDECENCRWELSLGEHTASAGHASTYSKSRPISLLVLSQPVRDRHNLMAIVPVRIQSDKTSAADYISRIVIELTLTARNSLDWVMSAIDLSVTTLATLIPAIVNLLSALQDVYVQ